MRATSKGVVELGKILHDNSEMKSWNDSRRYLKLTIFDEILSRMQKHFASYIPKIEPSRVDKSLGRICAENVKSISEIPDRTIAAMDGYAVRSSELTSATPTNPKLFTVKGSMYPGHKSKLSSLTSQHTYYVATGAPIPPGADAVVRVEETTQYGNHNILVRHPIEKGKNISKKGEDIGKGQTIVKKGQVLNPTDIALLMGVGRTHVKVYRALSVGLLSIGNELQEFRPYGRGRGHAGRVINNYLHLLSGYTEQFGSRAISLGICSDDERSIKRAILQGLRSCDVLLTISGSSVGRHDNVLGTIKDVQGSEVLFHGVRVVPIRPAGVVIIRQKPVVMIPGHAVSALLTFFVIAIPILNMMSGLMPQSRKAMINVELKTEVANKRAIDALCLVKLIHDSNRNYKVLPLSWGANLMSNLSQADGFVWLIPHQVIPKGQTVAVQLFNASQIAKSAWS